MRVGAFPGKGLEKPSETRAPLPFSGGAARGAVFGSVMGVRVPWPAIGMVRSGLEEVKIDAVHG